MTLELRTKGLKTIIKSDNTPVTNGDIEVDKKIREKLTEITPNIPLISEETVNLNKKNFRSALNLTKISVNGLFLTSLISFLSLIYSYVVSDFSVVNVFQNSHTTKPLIYKGL